MGIAVCTKVSDEFDGVAPDVYYGTVQCPGKLYKDNSQDSLLGYSTYCYYYSRSVYDIEDQEAKSVRVHPDADMIFSEPDDLQFSFSV